MQRGDAPAVQITPTLDGSMVRIPLPAVRFETVNIEDREYFAANAEGCTHSMEPGRAPVPVRRILVDVPRNCEIQITTETLGERSVNLSRADVAPRRVAAESILNINSNDPNAPRFVNIDTEPLAGNFPEQWAQIEYVGDYGSRHVASVLVACAKVDAQSKLAVVADQIVIQLKATSSAAMLLMRSSPPLYTIVSQHNPPAPGHSPTAHTPSLTGPSVAPPQAFPQTAWALKVQVNQRGIFKITKNDLVAAGIPASVILPKRLVMRLDDRVMPILVEGESDGVMDANDRVLFYGEPETGPYTRSNAYFLSQLTQDATAAFGSNARMADIDGTPHGQVAAAGWFRCTTRSESNAIYWQLLPNGAGKDHWFWTKTLAPSNTTFPLAISDLALPGTGSAKVRVSLHGYTDPVQNPDHHTRIKIGSNVLTDVTWNGIQPLLQEGSVASTLLTGGTTNATLEQVADTGAVVDGIYMDWAEIEYDRFFFALSNELAFNYANDVPSSFIIRKFTNSKIYVFDVTNPSQVARFVNGTVAGSGQFLIGFDAPATGVPGSVASYYSASENALRVPLSITQPQPRIAVPAAGADLIIIAPQNYHSPLAPLVQRRVAQGLRVFVVTPESIYDQFGGGVVGPGGILKFLQDAYGTWTAPAPKYLLLVGDASLDPMNYLGVGLATQIPAPMHQVLNDGEIPSDHYYACLTGNDPLPELLVGRIPAANTTEVSAAVAKIVAHETAAPAGAWRTTVQHFADKGTDFTNAMNALASGHVPGAYTVHSVFADNYATTGLMHTATVAELNTGAAIATYLGHGSFVNWSSYLNLTDAGAMSNGAKAGLITALNCSNGYFSSPSIQHGMGEALLLTPNGGGVGCFASSGLGFLSQLAPIANYAYDRAFAGQKMGEVTTGAKVDAYLQNGISEDNLWQSLLLGDPAGGVIP